MPNTPESPDMGQCPRDQTSGRPHSFQIVQGAKLNQFTQSEGTVLFCTKCGQSYLLQRDGWMKIPISHTAMGEPTTQEQEQDDDRAPSAILGARRQGM